MHQALDVDAWRDDVVRIDIAGLHEVLDFRHGDLAGGGHHWIEVARGLAVNEVALGIAHPSMDDREIGDKSALHDVELAVNLALLLALRNLSPGAGPGEERRDAGAAGADTFGQRALRIGLDLQFAREVLLRESLVLSNIGRDHLLDLLGVEQQAKADTIDAAVVGDDGQVLHARVADRQDQLLRNAAKPEPAGHDQHAVLQQAGERCPGIGIDLLHKCSRFRRGRRRRSNATPVGRGIVYRAAAKPATSQRTKRCGEGESAAISAISFLMMARPNELKFSATRTNAPGPPITLSWSYFSRPPGGLVCSAFHGTG